MSALLPDALVDAAARLIADCVRQETTLAIAESCTGGLVSAALTAIPGSSAVLERGFVCYANAAKTEQLGVPADLIAAHGAVSEPVARAMAEGAVARSAANRSVAITGIAGPGGGSPDKPVGTVHIARTDRDGATRHERWQFDGDRDAVRLAATLAALAMLGT